MDYFFHKFKNVYNVHNLYFKQKFSTRFPTWKPSLFLGINYVFNKSTATTITTTGKTIYIFIFYTERGYQQMKLSCSKDSLLNAINIVSKAVSARTTLPILECILLTADENGLKLTSNDMELAIESAYIEADIQTEGNVALDARFFSDIIRKVSGETVDISVDEKFIATIACGKSEFKISGQNGEDFPPIPEVEKNVKYVISQNDLRNLIRQTIFSISQDESKPVLTGELIEIEDNMVDFVSVDGYRISYKQAELVQSVGSKRAIVPGKSLGEIAKILSADEDEKAVIYFTDNHIMADINGNIVVSRLIQGEFIKYQQSFTNEYKTSAKINRNEMLNSLERASLISRDSRKIPVKLEISGNNIIITSNAETSTAYEEVSAEIDGDRLTIAFNPKYLIDSLKAIDDDEVYMHFNTPLSPCVFKPVEGEDYKYLVLPLRI